MSETCALEGACRRVSVSRESRIPLTKPVPCKADGTTCELTLDLYYPTEPPPSGTTYPVAVVERGGPDVPGSDGAVALLLAGQGVVVVDGSWRQSTQFGGGGTVGLGDIACAVSAARSIAPRVGGARDRIVLIGHSLGGWAGAVITLTKGGYAPDPAQCLFDVAGATVDAFAGLAGPYAEIHSTTDDQSWELIVGGTRAAAPDAWAALDPLALLERYGPPTASVLLLHGDPDGYVQLGESEQLAAALTAAGLETHVIVEPDVDHGEIRTAPATVIALLDLLLPT